MDKTIYFINDYAGSRYHGMEFRNYYYAKEFVKMGFTVYIITASYMHLFKKFPKVDNNFTFENIDGINYIWVKVPKYRGSTDKKRVLKWFTFTLKLFILPLKNMKKPDIVIASPMAPFLTIPAYRLAKKYNAKFIYEVKDIWPLSIIELGNISKANPLIKLMSWCEKFGIKKADSIVSSLQNYGEHLKTIGIKKDFVWLNNGIDLEEMQNIEKLPQEVEKQLPKNKFIVGYTGTVGIANALEYFCKAAKELQNMQDIAFVIVGDGKFKEDLQKRYSLLNNLYFINPVKKQQVQSILQYFDVCYIGWNRENIYKYGISPNKIFDYMYSSKPILHAFDFEDADIVKLANCGISVKSENVNSISEGIIQFYNMTKEEREELGENGKNYVLMHFTYKMLAKKYSKLFSV